MYSHSLSIEQNLLFDCSNQSFPQDQEASSQSLIIANSKPHSQKGLFNQLNEPLLAQSIQIYSKSDLSEEESKMILTKVEEIDKRLEEGWYLAYQLWLYVIIVAAPLKGVFLAAFVQDMWWRRDDEAAQICSVLLVCALYCIFWTVKQALLQNEALREKDQVKAAQAYRSLVQLACYYLILCIVFFLLTVLFIYSSTERKYWLQAICYLFLLFIAHYVIPVGISVKGSYQLKILLEEKMDLLLKADNRGVNSSALRICEKYKMILL